MTFSDRARAHVEQRLPAAAAHSPEEMFLRLLERGADARAAGNYGIAAAYVLRAGGRELVAFGENSVFSESDPAGHAEMNAMRLARTLALAGEAERRRLLGDARRVLVRDAPHDRLETLLYSTLEPCPMCTVAIVNAGVEEVLVAQEDADAGTLLHLDRLPPLWPDFARQRGLRVTRAALPRQLDELLERLFLDDKDNLDRRLGEAPVLPVQALAQLLRQ
ncbi:MAG TPA: deaminase [Solirubrobacteraceae bacterium]|nr:deaminase [Solirubrobacteraceae bacterium]